MSEEFFGLKDWVVVVKSSVVGAGMRTFVYGMYSEGRANVLARQIEAAYVLEQPSTLVSCQALKVLEM